MAGSAHDDGFAPLVRAAQTVRCAVRDGEILQGTWREGSILDVHFAHKSSLSAQKGPELLATHDDY